MRQLSTTQCNFQPFCRALQRPCTSSLRFPTTYLLHPEILVIFYVHTPAVSHIVAPRHLLFIRCYEWKRADENSWSTLLCWEVQVVAHIKYGQAPSYEEFYSRYIVVRCYRICLGQRIGVCVISRSHLFYSSSQYLHFRSPKIGIGKTYGSDCVLSSTPIFPPNSR
jgi:hypothetical protein